MSKGPNNNNNSNNNNNKTAPVVEPTRERHEKNALFSFRVCFFCFLFAWVSFYFLFRGSVAVALVMAVIAADVTTRGRSCVRQVALARE